MFWMIEGTLYRITYPRFASLFGFGQNDANRPKLHLQPPLPLEEMRFMYPRGQVHNAGKVASLYTYYSILNRLLRKTITPRGGNPADISLHARNLLATLRSGGPDFCVGDFIWEEIKYISENSSKICGYAPYLMIMIEKVTKTKYGTDARHERLRPSVPKQRVMPSPHRYSKNEDEMETEE